MKKEIKIILLSLFLTVCYDTTVGMSPAMYLRYKIAELK